MQNTQQINLLIFLSLPFIISCNNTHPALEEMKELHGSWSGSSGDVKIFENWISEEDHLSGTAWVMKGSDTLVHEYMRIELRNGQPVFTAKVNNANPVSFTLIPTEKNTWIFENLEHDFPQRVAYILKNPGELDAYVEGLQNGENIREDFNYKKIETKE